MIRLSNCLTTDDVQANLDAVLGRVAQQDPYTQFCTVLTAYAESDLHNDSRQGDSVGLFQQKPQYWPGILLDPEHATDLFVASFTGRAHTGQPVIDCWAVQQWQAPNPGDDRAGFYVAAETQNYSRRLAAVPEILRTHSLPM